MYRSERIDRYITARASAAQRYRSLDPRTTNHQRIRLSHQHQPPSGVGCMRWLGDHQPY